MTRNLQWLIIYIMGLSYIAVSQSGLVDLFPESYQWLFTGWFFKHISNMTAACGLVYVMYWAHRSINHFRTHIVIERLQYDYGSIAVMCSWIIGIAIAVGLAYGAN